MKTVEILSKFLVIARKLFRKFCCAAQGAFGRRAEPERERGRMERGGSQHYFLISFFTLRLLAICENITLVAIYEINNATQTIVKFLSAL